MGKAHITNVDNSDCDISMSSRDVARATQMKKLGCSDREIWDELFSDDWNPPPGKVTIIDKNCKIELNLWYQKW